MNNGHPLAIAGLTLSVLGSLYLSYDLLGKPGGLLRRLIPGVSYGVFLAGAAWVQLILLDALNLNSYIADTSPVGSIIGLLIEIERNYPFSPFIYGAILGALAPQPAARSTEAKSAATTRGPWPIVFSLCAVGVLACLSILDYLHTGSALLSLAVGTSMVGLLLLFVIFPLVLVPRVSALAENLPERQLGGIGAFMTLLGFVVQLALQLTT